MNGGFVVWVAAVIAFSKPQKAKGDQDAMRAADIRSTRIILQSFTIEGEWWSRGRSTATAAPAPSA